MAPLHVIGKNGDTVETVRELIAVPPWIAAVFQVYMRTRPVEEPAFRTVFSYR